MRLQAADSPNFVVIFCDDLGYGDVGAFGNPTIRTPHLDRMAREGQKWTSFYVGASVCTPSRAALLTGRLPIRNGMMSAERRVLFPDSPGGLPHSELTIAEVLKTKGYATAAVGKWHLGHLPQHLPTNHGFDSYWGIPYSNDMDAQRGFPNYRTQGQKDPNYFAPIEQYQVPIIHNTTVVERPANQHTITQRYTDRAIDFIRQNRNNPFFVYLAHNLPHIPLYAGEKHLGKSRRGIFGDVIEEIDSCTGQILDALRELELDENTLVIFTSDNGPWLPFQTHGGSAGLLREGKGSTFEGGMREPTIFWWPGRIKPGVQMQMGATMDLLPTFCSFAGAKIPSDRTLDGYDLTSLLTGKTDKSPRNTVYYWRSEELYAIRQGPWKAHFITEGCYGIGPKREVHDTPELYNLEHDPSEKYNVANLHPGIVSQLIQAANLHKNSLEPTEDQLAGRFRSTPWKGNQHLIPGKIEAEHYDQGKPEQAYHDVDEENQGANYRGATQVDIEKRSDASNGHGIGWTRKGEWLAYKVAIEESGTYEIEIPVASQKKGGVFHLEINGKDVTGSIDVPNTGSWQKLVLLKHGNVTLERGVYLMKAVMDEEGPSGSIGDIDYFRFKRVSD